MVTMSSQPKELASIPICLLEHHANVIDTILKLYFDDGELSFEPLSAFDRE